MVNLNGLNILNVGKAAAPERTKPVSPRSQDGKESSFKDVLGQNSEKLNTPTKENPKKEVAQQKDTPQKAVQKNEAQPKESAKKEQTQPDNRLAKSAPQVAQPKENSEKSDKLEAKSEVQADSIPGAPSNIPSFDRTPDFSQPSPTMLAMKSMAPNMKDASGEEGIDSLTRRAVWNDFLRKMNDELGITADKVLEAFSTLDDAELASPPEQNVQKLVMALGLNPQQSQIAQKLFSELIQKTQSKSLASELGNAATQINLSLMSQREVQRKQMQTSLEKMNSSFFMAGQQRPIKPMVQENQLQSADQQKAAPLAQDLTTVAAPELGAPFKLAPPVETSIPVATPTVTQAAPQKINQIVSKMQAASEEDQAVFAETFAQNKDLFTDGVKPQTSQAAHLTANAASAAPVATAATETANQGAQAAAKAFAQALGIDLNGSQGSDGDEASSDTGEGLSEQLMPTNRNFQAAPSEGGFSIAPNAPTQQGPAVPQMAVPDLINHARVMVREGGGEMKVSLTPEGMGEVAMKVSVKDGRVNVQMITESDEAKKMIEKGLADLKTNLHSNNLSVDTIKVDTATNLGRQLEQQYHEAQRQNAQQFLQDFRQNQQGWRQNFLATPSSQIARSQSQGGASQPTPYYNGERKGANGSRRLDLVA